MHMYHVTVLVQWCCCVLQQEKEFQERLKASHNIITMLDNKLGELSKMGYDQLPDLLHRIRQMTAGNNHLLYRI